MIPILYKSDEVDFYDNGLGALNDIYDVDVQEQRNGLFTLTASYPVSGRRYKDIEVGRIVLAKPNQNDKAQAFRIIHTELDISGYALTIEADHITYDLTHNLVKSVHLQGNGQNAMTHLQQATVAPHMFRFISDLQHEGNSTLTMVNPMEAIAGTQGSILQIWGGELKRDNRTVSMLSRRGRNNFTSFRLGKNINGLKYTVDTANLVTRIVPSVQRPNGNENELIIGNIVDSKNVGNYPNYYMQHVDVADKIKIDENDSDDVIKGKINAYAKNWFTQSANSKIDLPEVTVEIDVTSLQDSADYQDKFKNLEAIELTDSVTVYVPEFGVNVQAVVNELHYDPVAERVTSIVIGTSKLSFADANSNTLKELGSSINKIRENAVTAIVSANGKNTNYYGTEEPAHPVEGDLWFKSVGDETYLMIFKDGRWQEWVSTKTQDIINKQVDDALASAKEYTDELNDRQASEAAAFQSEANAALSSAAAERTVFSSNAASMATSAATHADSMANSASAYAKAQAASALSSANSALTAAKSDLTTAIEQEISDRNQAVQTVNSQAQDYADQAKSDAIEAAKTADGKVRKDFKETADALSSTISQNKEDAEGKISTAQTTATQALDGLSTKVSQTDYDKKTGDLSTAVNTVTQTATETKNELAKVSKTVGSQSAKINTISNTVDGTKQTISDIQTEQGKQSGSIATLQSRADGFDATVTKVNNLSVGGRNLYTDTKNFDNPAQWWRFSSWTKTTDTYNGLTVMQTSDSWNGISQYIPVKKGDVLTYSVYAKYTSCTGTSNVYWMLNSDPEGIYRNATTNITNKQVTITDSWQRISGTTVATSDGYLRPRLERTNNNANILQIAGIKVEKGNLPTDWSPAPEDVSGATAHAQLTADNATLAINDYKTNADGRIHKAQSDITATSKEVKTKVSQTDYNAKTDDLTEKYGQVKATADAVKTDVAKYKKSNDGRVSANEAHIETLNNQITSKVSQTVFNETTGKLSGNYTETKQTVDSISNIVTELQAKANAQGQVNQLMNTEFTPDLQGWITDSTDGSKVPYRSYARGGAGSITVGFNSTDASSGSTIRLIQTVILAGSTDRIVSLRWAARTLQNDNYDNVRLLFRDANNSDIGEVYRSWADTSLDGTWHEIKWENITVPDNASTVTLYFQAREGTRAYLNKPMLVFANTIGDYVPGNYNNNARVTALELDVDGIHGLVDDPSKGLSATWNLASDGQSIAVQAKTDASTADGKAVAAQKDATTAITTANGTQTTVKSVKKDVKDLQSITTQTAGQVTIEIEDRKNGDTNMLSQAKSFTTSRITSYDEGIQSQFTQQAKGIMASVSTPNQLLNTEFSPDLDGWTTETTSSTKVPYQSYWNTHNQARTVAFNTTSGASSSYSRMYQNVQLASTTGSGNSISLSWSGRANQLDNYANLWANFYNASGNKVSSVNTKWVSTADGSWNDSKWENIPVPDTATSVRISFEAREGTIAYLSHPMLVFGSTIGDAYMPGSYSGMNTSTVLELFKDNWALGITDNSGKIISGINGDTSGVAIKGKHITLDGNVTVTDDFYAKGGNFQNLNASNLKTGTLNAANINVINMNASNLSSGTIRGINIEAADISLVNDNSQIHGNYDWGDSDEAIFPRQYVGNWTLGKRRLQYYGDVTPNDSTNDGGKYSAYTYYGLDSIKMRRLFATGNLNRTVDIDAGKGELYIRKRDNEQQDMNANITVVEAGKAQFRGDNSRLVVSTNKVLDAKNIVNTVQLKAGNDDETSSVQGYHIRGKRFSPPTGYDDNVWMYFYPSGDDTYYGLGLLRGKTVAQGYLSSTWAYSNTYSYSSNMYVTSNGNIGRATSASKYKLAITHYDELDRANKLLNIDPARWFDKAETEQYADELSGVKDSVEKLPVKPHFGLIAEDLVDAGLEEFVSYDTNTGEVEGLEYDRVWTVLIPLIRDMKKRIEELESEK